MDSASPTVEKERRRRTLVFADLADKSYGQDRVLNGKDDVSEQVCLRAAARCWEQDGKFKIGSLSNPRQLADDRWRCTGHCFRHEGCAEGQGRTFQFTGPWHKTVYCLSIGVAGECSGPPRRAREARKFDEDEITVDERLCILREAETLLEAGRPCAPSTVQMRLKGLDIPAARVRAVLKNRKRNFGGATQTFLESAKSFRKSAEGVDQNVLQFPVLDAQSNSFHWVGLLIPFFLVLLELQPDWLVLTSDATHNLTIMGHRYGLV